MTVKSVVLFLISHCVFIAKMVGFLEGWLKRCLLLLRTDGWLSLRIPGYAENYPEVGT